MNRRLLSIFSVVAIVALLACGDKDRNNNDDGKADDYKIYVTGNVSTNSTSGPNFATLWDTSKLSIISKGISDGKPSEGGGRGRQVFLSGNDVYVAGSNSVNNVNYWYLSAATYWKNGEEIVLSAHEEHAYSNSIFVIGDDVYVAGHIFMDGFWSRYPVGVLWKNGERTYLTNPDEWESQTSVASSVFVSDGDVYVGGRQMPGFMRGYSATVWKNGEPQVIDNGRNSSLVNSIVVSNGNVYAAGYAHLPYEHPNFGQGFPCATLWINGEPRYLPPPRTIEPLNGFNPEASMAHSVFVSGNDVYVVGYGQFFQIGGDDESSGRGGKRQALLWKNGKQIFINEKQVERAEANSVFVVKDDVFVVGWEQLNAAFSDNAIARLWKNGAPYNKVLDTAGYPHSVANSIVVVPPPVPLPNPQ